LAAMTEDPMVRAGGVLVIGPIVDVDEPTISKVFEESVRKATTVVASPEPTVMLEPGTRVWPASTYCVAGPAALELAGSTVFELEPAVMAAMGLRLAVTPAKTIAEDIADCCWTVDVEEPTTR